MSVVNIKGLKIDVITMICVSAANRQEVEKVFLSADQ